MGKVVRVQSFTDSSCYYEVDIDEVSCTCTDWYRRRMQYPLGDSKRMCKHIASVTIEYDLGENWGDGYIQDAKFAAQNNTGVPLGIKKKVKPKAKAVPKKAKKEKSQPKRKQEMYAPREVWDCFFKVTALIDPLTIDKDFPVGSADEIEAWCDGDEPEELDYLFTPLEAYDGKTYFTMKLAYNGWLCRLFYKGTMKYIEIYGQEKIAVDSFNGVEIKFKQELLKALSGKGLNF